MDTAIIIGIILLITYFALIYFAARGGNLMIGFFIMAVIWVALCIIGGELTWQDAQSKIFQGGPESWGATAVNVIFGSWFGRILIETGIASKLIKSVTELGGDNPLFTTILLSIVTGIIFTSTFGAGAVVAIGVIILPILIEEELKVKEVGKKKGIEVTAAADISKLYGLTRRTRTAIINASILPRMFETANSTESAVRTAGIKAPLMIMRGDGGVMDIEEMRKRTVLTMLSGPAASTVGALMYLRVSNGIFFEVGGTSTDIGVIKNGRPMVDYAVVGGQSTLINSLDVHVSGVAGGSMVRASNNKIIHVGPRSAHIANLPYSAFTDTSRIVNPRVIRIQPLEGDPNDYVAIECDGGFRCTITVTCAATALGIVKPGDFAYGNPESSKKAITALANELGMSMEDCANAILDNAADTCIEVIEELALKYKVERDQITLIGGGGGATALLPFTAKKMSLPYKIAEHAEVISSIGVALAMVRDVVERVIPNPTPQDLADIRIEATDMAIKSGATADSVEIQIEIDSQTSKVRAIATGSTEIQTQDLSKKVTMEEVTQIAADSMRIKASEAKCIVQNNGQADIVRKQDNQKNGKLDLIELCERLGIKVREESTTNAMDFVYFGTYEYPGLITIYSDNIQKGEELAALHGISGLRDKNFKEIVLAHEIFHHIEYNNQSLFTHKFVPI